MSAGIQFAAIKVDNDLICDGHHRYIASLLANFKLDRSLGRTTSATTAVCWESVSFDDEDWDSPAKIDMLNKQDAAYNDITLAEILDLLK